MTSGGVLVGIAAALACLHLIPRAVVGHTAAEPTEPGPDPEPPSLPQPEPEPDPEPDVQLDDDLDTQPRLSQRLLGFSPDGDGSIPVSAPAPTQGWSARGWKPRRNESRAEKDRQGGLGDASDISWRDGDHDYHEVKAGCIDPFDGGTD